MVTLTPVRDQHAGTISPSQAVLHLTLDESVTPPNWTGSGCPSYNSAVLGCKVGIHKQVNLTKQQPARLSSPYQTVFPGFGGSPACFPSCIDGEGCTGSHWVAIALILRSGEEPGRSESSGPLRGHMTGPTEETVPGCQALASEARSWSAERRLAFTRAKGRASFWLAHSQALGGTRGPAALGCSFAVLLLKGGTRTTAGNQTQLASELHVEVLWWCHFSAVVLKRT